ncbi:4'-phosphopantetheinyl transferase family protein [Catellatospora sichuanensis]|uniref:4'-phosphopantetheinyl transferase family protein n=1 Tax=Catellatospora sichuanensis TaxID=1969805 RepID=UPI0011821AB2|nr:4'-phosphopantetheinyl transferase superfamily protein [Catellatospora sichuanensis]
MIEELLEPDVIAVEAFGDVPGEPIFPGEEALLANSVPARRQEFVTARRCAREALGRLGFSPAPIGTGPRREPLWPHGVAGAITHCVGYRAAAITTKLAAIGIDAEPNGPLPPDVADQVTTAGEPAMLAELAGAYPSIPWGRVLFSAKESVYKAWYPLTGRWLGFEEAVLTIDPAARTFRARLLTRGERMDGGVPLTGVAGRFLVTDRLILTAVTVE